MSAGRASAEADVPNSRVGLRYRIAVLDGPSAKGEPIPNVVGWLAPDGTFTPAAWEAASFDKPTAATRLVTKRGAMRVFSHLRLESFSPPVAGAAVAGERVGVGPSAEDHPHATTDTQQNAPTAERGSSAAEASDRGGQ